MKCANIENIINSLNINILFLGGVNPRFAESDTGNGIVTIIDGIIYLHGMINLKPPETPPFSVVTNVTKHYQWIKEILSQIKPISTSTK